MIGEIITKFGDRVFTPLTCKFNERYYLVLVNSLFIQNILEYHDVL